MRKNEKRAASVQTDSEGSDREFFARQLTERLNTTPVALPLGVVSADTEVPDLYHVTGPDGRLVDLEFSVDDEVREVTCVASRGGVRAQAASFARQIENAVGDAVGSLMLSLGLPA